MKKLILALAIAILSGFTYGQKRGEIKSTCYYFIIGDGSFKPLASMTCDGIVYVKRGYRLLVNKEMGRITLVDKRTRRIVNRLQVDQIEIKNFRI